MEISEEEFKERLIIERKRKDLKQLKFIKRKLKTPWSKRGKLRIFRNRQSKLSRVNNKYIHTDEYS